MAYTVYIIECADGTLYCGQTADLPRRIMQHNEGRGGRYTRARRPVKLVYTEEYQTRRLSMKRETEIKKMTRAKKLELIESNK
jgi:putative endonuclease